MSSADVVFHLRRDDGRWSTDNIVLGPGEPGVSGHVLGIGDGHTGWNELPKFVDETLAGQPDPQVLADLIDEATASLVARVAALEAVPPPVIPPDLTAQLNALTARVAALEEAPPPEIPDGFEIIDLDAENKATYVLPLNALGVTNDGTAQLILGDGVKTVNEHIGNPFTPNATRMFASIQRNYAWSQGAVDAWNNGNNVLARIAALEGGG